MSFGRKTSDGVNFRGGDSTEERGSSESVENPHDKHVTSKTTRRIAIQVDSELFAEDTEKDRYLITYADLITLLLGLFILLYAMSNVDLKKYENVMSAIGTVFGGSGSGKVISIADQLTISEQPSIRTFKEDVQDIINESQFVDKIALVENDRGVTIRIQDDILFAPGNANLSPNSLDILSKIAEILVRVSNDIRIEGHTDNVPISTSAFPSNWHLSVARAVNTAYFLMNEHKLDPDRVTVVGYSEYKPIAENDSPEGRLKNRRVDIVILK